MKKVILSISAFFIIGILQAQYITNWTEPIAITDSISLNSNPVVLTIFEDGNDDVFCFYEKRSSESSPTQIWYRNIHTMTDEQLVFGEDVFEYRNPKIFIQSPDYDSRYFLFYESNKTGNFNIYGNEVFTDGTLGPSFLMLSDEWDESSFFITQNDNSQIAGCWESGNKIQFSGISFSGDTLQFNEVFTIDTINCYNPVCYTVTNVYKIVYYRKIINDSSQIYFSEYDEIENTWTEPDTLYATGNNININSVGYSYYFPNQNLCWENNGEIMFYDNWQNQTETIETSISGNYEPSYITSMYGVKAFYPVYLTFCSGEGNNREVYSMGDWGFVQQITSNNYFESNPKIFYERFYYDYFNAVSIWETYKNNNRVLYMSRRSFDLMGSIDDNKSGTNRIIKASPNPFKNELKIEYFLSANKKASLDIYTLTGKHIDHININSQKPGWNVLSWNTSENGKNNLPEGVYFVTLRQGNETATQKIIYSE